MWFVIDNMFGQRQFLMTTVHVFWSILYLWLGLFVIYLGSSTLSEVIKLFTGFNGIANRNKPVFRPSTPE